MEGLEEFLRLRVAERIEVLSPTRTRPLHGLRIVALDGERVRLEGH